MLRPVTKVELTPLSWVEVRPSSWALDRAPVVVVFRALSVAVLRPATCAAVRPASWLVCRLFSSVAPSVEKVVLFRAATWTEDRALCRLVASAARLVAPSSLI